MSYNVLDVPWRSEVTVQVLAFVDEYKRQHPYSPDIREIGHAVGISSTSVVNYHLDHLEEAGFVGFLYIERKGSKGRNRGARTVHVTRKGKAYLAEFERSRNAER